MYEIELNENGYYVFVTNNNITYYCRFIDSTNRISPVLGVYDVKIYEFDFYYSKPGDASQAMVKIDNEIASTISHLLRQQFVHPNIVIIYMCDSSDGRDEVRQRLFAKWHLLHGGADILRKPVEIELDENNTIIYCCVLLRSDFEHPEILDAQIKDNANGIFAEKFGE